MDASTPTPTSTHPLAATPGHPDASPCTTDAPVCTKPAPVCTTLHPSGAGPHSLLTPASRSTYTQTAPVPCTTSEKQPPTASSGTAAPSILSDPNRPASDQLARGTAPLDALLELTLLQKQAIELLVQGKSVSQVARYLEINRSTINRWKAHHPRFIAEYARRAASSQTDAALEARNALDLALKVILKGLHGKPRDAHLIALRLLASPRIARTSQPDQQIPPESDSAFLQTLADDLNAPPPPDSPWKRLSKHEQYNADRLAKRPPRPELAAAVERYHYDPASVSLIVRRPDFHPIDIHYLAHLGSDSGRPPGPYVAQAKLPGVESTLCLNTLEYLVQNGLIQQLAGRRLADHEIRVLPAGVEFKLRTNPTTRVFIDRENIWRDTLIP